MSLRIFTPSLILLSTTNLVLGSNSGSLDEELAKDSSAAGTVGKATKTVATEAAKVSDVAVATATVVATAYESAAATTETHASVTYNQWGFTGSQSVWLATTASTVTTGSHSSSHSSVVHSVQNSTSGATKLTVHGSNSVNVKTVAMVAGLLGLSTLISAM